MKITYQEILNVSKLAPIERYKYFIKRAVDFEKLYSLKNSTGDWAITEVDNHKLFSLWSSKEFAEQCLIGLWKDYNIVEITLEDFVDNIVPQIELNNYLLNVFSVQNKSGFIVELDEFIKDFQEEQ